MSDAKIKFSNCQKKIYEVSFISTHSTNNRLLGARHKEIICCIDVFISDRTQDRYKLYCDFLVFKGTKKKISFLQKKDDYVQCKCCLFSNVVKFAIIQYIE